MRTGPDQRELLRAVEYFLGDIAIPKLRDRDQFLARVAANIVKTVLRELDLEEVHLSDERRALGELLGEPPPHPASLSKLREESSMMTQRLCELIRTGLFDDEPKRRELIGYLKRSVLGGLEMNDPKLAERIRMEWNLR